MGEHDVRTVTDTRVLAAMTHPLRRRLLSILKLDGPSTASALAQRTEQGVGNISHHLHVLAAAGLIEEVPPPGPDPRRGRVGGTRPPPPRRLTSLPAATDAPARAPRPPP